MSEYLVYLVSTSAVVGFGTLLMHRGEERIGGAALGVVLLCAVLSPLFSLVGALDGVSTEDILGDVSYGEEGNEDYIERTQAAFEEGVARAVADEFDLNKEEVRAYAYNYDFERVRAEKIKIVLSGAATYADSRGISAFVREGGLGECEVELEFT